MKIDTDTFRLGNKPERYCSYCGEKAVKEDIGSTHNHRWEEEIIYYCNCENSKKESEIREKLASLNSELYITNRDARSKLKQLEDFYELHEFN